jgi:hypothetical protein
MLYMWPKVYDGTRTLQIMAQDGTVSSVDINKPNDQQHPHRRPRSNPACLRSKPEGMADVEEILNNMEDVAEFAVTISSGPSYDTLRQEAVDGMIATAQSWPKLMDIAGDKVIRSMDWPMADEIADRVEKTIPPALKVGEKDQDENEQTIQTPMGPVPISQAPQMLQELFAQLQEVQQQADANQATLEKARIDAASREKIAEIGHVQANDVAELNGLIKLLVPKLQPRRPFSKRMWTKTCRMTINAPREPHPRPWTKALPGAPRRPLNERRNHQPADHRATRYHGSRNHDPAAARHAGFGDHDRWRHGR